jgi:hypothetical protein
MLGLVLGGASVLLTATIVISVVAGADAMLH